MNDEQSAYADGHLVPTDRAGEELINKLCADLCINDSLAMEILAWADENISHCDIRPMDLKNLVIHKSVSIEKIARMLVGRKDNISCFIRVLFWSLGDPALDEVLNHQYPAHWARQYGLSKYALTKMAETVQAQFNLPPRADQRNDKSRKKMSEVRKKFYENNKQQQ